jgi:metallophosphoesterase superfamily enzyme
MTLSLEQMIKEAEKNLVISDLHIPFEDSKAISCMLDYAKQYKPNRVIINGDLVDFYSISDFDRCPERKETVKDEIYKAREFLHLLRKTVGDNAEINYLHGNHENRLQKFMWRNSELYGLDCLELKNLLDLKKYNVNEVKVDRDYWSKEEGELRVGDTTILHGDARLNRAKYSSNPGYAAFNTLRSRIGENVIIGHTHRMAQIFNMIGNKNNVGMESGCLCQMTRNNWQQGFLTFENINRKSFNYKTHPINNGKLMEDGKVYG